jgi:hypothetical protein
MKYYDFTGTGEKLYDFATLTPCAAEVLTLLCFLFFFEPSSEKKQRSKNFCSTRDVVAKLCIGIHVNWRFRRKRRGGCI